MTILLNEIERLTPLLCPLRKDRLVFLSNRRQASLGSIVSIYLTGTQKHHADLPAFNAVVAASIESIYHMAYKSLKKNLAQKASGDDVAQLAQLLRMI